ncbi:MBOAT family O-acyltransferase [Winogradskyella poriferorum]|uniref:MBOAT family O-acyltransferase n=1 Tax=Winogradskyella poriferorum TaxID=307627 RepID=UPI003D662B0C
MAQNNLRWVLPKISFLLPVGISYYTFMAIGYTIDVYNEEIEVEKNIGVLGLFISFFPLILSGPIERANNLIPQFRNNILLKPENVKKGLKLMLWGYFMKLVVADRLAIYIDVVFENLQNHNGNTILLATLLYPIQVYGDLGGYSLLAIGVAKILGIDVMSNFNRPFFSTSMAEFWRRWHISLIKWLTDYVYTPLAFSFRSLKLKGIILALMVTFILSGLWHEGTINFFIWGVIQGAYLSFEASINTKRIKLETKYNLKQNILYVSFFICFTYLLFAFSEVFGRSNSINDSLLAFEKIILDKGILFLDKTTLTYGLIGASILLLSDFKAEYFPNKFRTFDSPYITIRWFSYITITLLILWIGILNGGQFIYFKF